MIGNTLLNLVFCPWEMHALFAASRLRVFSLLASDAMTADELAGRIRCEARLLEALLDACVGMGLLRCTDGRYANTHVSDAHLVEGRPLYLGDIIEVQAGEAAAWGRLYDVIMRGSEALKDVPEPSYDRRRFTLAMNNLAMQGEAQALANAVDLAGCETLVDAGCGSGMYSIVLCERCPRLTATLLDHPEVLEVAQEFVAKHGLQDRITTREADITSDAFGENLDVVLLSDVLYHEKALCMRILRSAYDAVATGGRLVIRGYFSDPEGSQPLFGSIFALKLQFSAPEREAISAPKLRKWIEDAGFKDVQSFALTERSTCMTATKR